MNPDTPTLGEIVRRLDEIARRMERIAQDATERERLFVRTDVFEERQKTDLIQMRGLEAEVHSIGKRLDAAEERARSTRVLLWTSLAAPLLVGLVLAAVLAGVG